MAPTTYIEAIRQALWEEMEKDPTVFLMGEDIGEYGGAFKVTEGFLQHFGPDRVLVTEFQGQRVSERNFKGEVKWEKALNGNPLSAQRLVNAGACAPIFIGQGLDVSNQVLGILNSKFGPNGLTPTGG